MTRWKLVQVSFMFFMLNANALEYFTFSGLKNFRVKTTTATAPQIFFNSRFLGFIGHFFFEEFENFRQIRKMAAAMVENV